MLSAALKDLDPSVFVGLQHNNVSQLLLTPDKLGSIKVPIVILYCFKVTLAFIDHCNPLYHVVLHHLYQVVSENSWGPCRCISIAECWDLLAQLELLPDGTDSDENAKLAKHAVKVRGIIRYLDVFKMLPDDALFLGVAHGGIATDAFMLLDGNHRALALYGYLLDNAEPLDITVDVYVAERGDDGASDGTTAASQEIFGNWSGLFCLAI